MKKILRISLLISAVAILAGCAGSGSHQRGLACDSRLESYCGGWTVYDDNDVEEPAKHIERNDQLVIGKRRGGNRDYILFARPSLEMKWNSQRIIPLNEIKQGRKHECFVGLVRLEGHGGDHEWHGLTLRTVTVVTPDIGEEDKLEVCLKRQDDDTLPTACAPLECEDGGPGDHGGRAHARD